MSTQQIQVEQVGDDVPVLVVSGEHDVYTAPLLREQLTQLVDGGRPIVVDLNGATFIDSSILGVLLGGLRRVRERDSTFGLVLGDDGEATVRRIFEVTGLLPVFSVYSTREEAVDAARADGVQ